MRLAYSLEDFQGLGITEYRMDGGEATAHYIEHFTNDELLDILMKPADPTNHRATARHNAAQQVYDLIV